MPKSTNGLSLPATSIIEEELCSITGIREARVLLDDDSSIGEVHVIASPRRSAKKVVRDIESFLVVRYGYRIDYRKISLVQPVERTVVDRVSLTRVEQIQQATNTFIEIELRNGQKCYQGQAIVDNDLALAAGTATINALNTLFAPRTPLNLVGIQMVTFGAREAITAYVTNQEGANEHMFGTTLVRQSVVEAAARAILAATNRRLSNLLPEQYQLSATDLVAAKSSASVSTSNPPASSTLVAGVLTV